MSNPNSNLSPQKEETTMEGVEQTPNVYTYVNGDNNKRLKLSELITQGEENLDSTLASPPSPPYKRFLGPDGHLCFETRDDLNYFIDNHRKDLRDEHRLDLIFAIENVPCAYLGMPNLGRSCAKLALEYYNEKHKDDYEYKSEYSLAFAGDIIHMNFYASRKVSESRPEPGPEQFFFAELETEHKVLDCCILDHLFIKSCPLLQSFECCPYGVVDEIIHPEGMNCSECDPF